MARNPKDSIARIEKIISAWQSLAPTVKFGGMSLEDFKKTVQPSFDTRKRVGILDEQIKVEQNKRDDADGVSLRRAQQVVHGVVGDPTYGPDSDLYEAMGYVRRSERKTGLTRKKKAAT